MVKLSKELAPKINDKYINLMASFADVFAWHYYDLKTYDTNIIQNTIPIKPNQKPFRQKLRRINPKLLPSIEKEVNRLYKSGFIVPIRFSNWISNLVPVCKKTSEICLCIDFKNLNKVSWKTTTHYPRWTIYFSELWGHLVCHCWMVILDITKFMSMKIIETRQRSPLHGEPFIMPKCPLV